MANLTDTAVWVDPVTGIDNGDPLDATELTAPETALTKRTRYLFDNGLVSSKTTIQLPLCNAAISTGWAQDGTSYILNTNVSSQNNFGIEIAPMLIPIGATIASVRAHVVGGQGGTHGGLPGTMPILDLQEITPATQVVTSVGAQSDTSASQPVYDAYHVVTLTVSKVIAAGKRYVVRFRGETGANTVNSYLAVWGIDITYTQP